MFFETFFDQCRLSYQASWDLEDQPSLLFHKFNFVEQQYYSRITPLILSILSIVPGSVYHATRSLDEFAAAIITLEKDSFRNFGLHLFAAGAHLVVLPLLGLWTFSAIGIDNDLLEKMRHQMKTNFDQAQTCRFPSLVGPIVMSPIRGITQCIESIALALFNLMAIPFLLPCTFQNKYDHIFAASCLLVIAAVSPIFGLAGFFWKPAREFLHTQ